jgi:hypothetical protein
MYIFRLDSYLIHIKEKLQSIEEKYTPSRFIFILINRFSIRFIKLFINLAK